MDRFVHAGFALLCFAAVSAGTGGADTPAAARPISPHVADVLAQASLRYVPAPAAAPLPPELTFASDLAEPKTPPSVVRLPDYLVRSRRLPTAEEVMSRGERERVAMARYLGEETSLDRALNLFSVAGLWSKIPVLGKVPFIVGQSGGRNSGPATGPRTSGQRAYDLYEADQQARQWADLRSLLLPSLRSASTGP